MVRTWPMRAARRAATNWENAARSPATKKTAPATCTGRAKRRNSHSTSSDCTTRPPPKESRLKSQESRSTTARERESGAAGPEAPCSTAGERRR